MAKTNSEQSLVEAQKSIERMREFDIESLPRVQELGTELNFSGAVEPALRLIDLYKRLSPDSLADLPPSTLTSVKDIANRDFAILNQIVEFRTAAQNSPISTRDQLILQVVNAYDSTFNALHHVISYSLARSADFRRLDNEARSTMQSIKDRAEDIDSTLKNYETEAKRVLDEVRKIAAEQGVTQQSIHFSTEAERHESLANEWNTNTQRLAVLLAIYAMVSAMLHKIPFLSPNTAYETVQLAISKILVFSVIAYMLFLSARNFLGHKHNAIVNKHRQNALMTHKALIEAASDSGVRDTIMVQAANCIFSPQNTGYIAGNSSEQTGSKSVVELLSKSVSRIE